MAMIPAKRRSEGDETRAREPAKRPRLADDAASALPPAAPSRDIVSTLSDELLVRILSYMDERVLLDISPVSRRFHRLTSDSQLWRPHYYRRFVLPRAHRIPGFRAAAAAANTRISAVTTDASWPSRRGPVDADTYDEVDWKKQYRLRYNWARGRCAVDQLPVHDMQLDRLPGRQTLVKVVQGLAVTADSQAGLRAWDLKTRKLIAQTSLVVGHDTAVRPTCLAADDRPHASGVLDVSAGFEDGTFGIWRLDVGRRELTIVFRQAKSYVGQLVALAYRHPYVIVATRLGFISLYTFDRFDDDGPEPDSAAAEAGLPTGETADSRYKGGGGLPPPRQLTSLKSHSSRLPLALSIRRTASSVVASIAYTFDAMGGWAIGIQDLDITRPGSDAQAGHAVSRIDARAARQGRRRP
ncbi:hypothetical protein CDD83_2538 [Cordyceps sp. RAO-2017]|nr:hypothetical protein CDD83_2538 [Cordyceps sp. RAO-2017]